MPAQSAEAICNLALDKLAADPISNIAAPVKPNEKLLARQYPHQRDAELRKHRWLFAMGVVRLTPSTFIQNDQDDKLYVYQMPTNALRAVRIAGTTWIVRGRTLLDPSSTYIDAKFIYSVAPALMDDLFIEAVASKIALVCCEKVTQSTEKKQDCKDDYKAAIDAARVANAFEVGPESYDSNDDSYSWLTARNI